jgi:hypothetical protein
MSYHRLYGVLFSLVFSAIFWTGIFQLVTSCSRREAPAAPASTPAQPPVETSALAAAKQKIKQALDAQAAAESKGDKLAKLQAEKDGLAALLEQKREEERDAREQLAAKKKEIASEREALAQARLYWFAGILGFLALVGGGVAIFVPVVSQWAVRFSVACGATASLALFAAWLVPYLIWIGIALGVVGLMATLVWWYRDHKTARQVIAGVEAAKDQLPGYKAHFRQFVDEDADKWVNLIRKRYKIQQVPRTPPTFPEPTPVTE